MVTNPLVFVDLNVFIKYSFCDRVGNFYNVYDCLSLTVQRAGMTNFCGVLCPTFVPFMC